MDGRFKHEQVALVVDAHRLVITGGAARGHKVGQLFDIHPSSVRKIYDPVTHEFLGDCPICVVEATDVQKLCTICELVKMYTSDFVHIGGLAVEVPE